MNNGSLQLVKCWIARSGFSSERVFTVSLPGQAQHVGAAPLEYFYDSAKRRLPDDQPKGQEEIEGYVATRVVKEDPTAGLLISVPSGDVLWVDPDIVTPMRNPPHVPAQS